MKRSLRKLKTSPSHRQQLSLVEWERTRAKGKARYIWRGAFHYCLIIIPAIAYWDYFFHGTIHSWQSAAFWVAAIKYFITGAFVAFGVWGDMEFQYKKARMGHQTPPADLGTPSPGLHPFNHPGF